MSETDEILLHIIDRDNAQKFYQALEAAFSRMSKEQLHGAYHYVTTRREVAISFDKDWQAFVVYKFGPIDEEDRTRIHGGGEFIKLAQSHLQELHKYLKQYVSSNEKRGGRILIQENCVYRFTYDTPILLFNYFFLGDNLNDVNPVKKILQLLNYHRKR